MSEKIDLYKALYPAFRFGLRRKFDYTIHGELNIPDRPALYTPNHIEMVDSPLIAAAYTEITGKPLRFGAKVQYFNGQGVDNNGQWGRSMKFLVEHTRMIPVDRDSKDPSDFRKLAQVIADRFDAGESIALHPEGTRSRDGLVHKFKTGAVRIALNQSVPLVPVGIVYDEYKEGQKTHVDIAFGEPIFPSEYTSLPYTLIPKRLKVERLSKQLQVRVAELTGMGLSDEYANHNKSTKE